MEEINKNLPQITEQLADTSTGQTKISPVDYLYNSIKSKAESKSLLEDIDSIKSDANYFSSMFSDNSQPQKISFNEDRINIEEAYTQLSDGSYITRYNEGFIKGADNEQLYAENQSKVSKWTNGLTKFVGKTAVNVIGGTLGTAYGAISAISQGNWEKIYDNDFYNFLDDQNTKMDNFVANYRTQEEQDMGFFESATTANFWADDFLGGLSFMTGTVISESLWAAATGGASLTTTAARLGLKGSKYLNTTKNLVKGVKEAQKTARKYNRLDAIKKATSSAVKYGKTGELLNLARFTYTGAGFEAGMEARLYQKEQKENFYRDFEKFNNRKPTSEEIAEFENNLDQTTNTLWATNMALVGTSNFAVLGKTFGITSPFSLPKKNLNKFLFGNGIKTTFGEAGERVGVEAIKRTKLQRGLGFAKGLLKNPIYEGVVEEGGQATASTALENYLTSRYNPNKEVMDIVESMYEGLSHTYGTKQGWKEVGLGMLIGLVGGEGMSVASGGGIFTEAREAITEQDSQSVRKANIQKEHSGINTVNKLFATKFEENLNQATEIQNAQKQYEQAQEQGDVMGMATAQGRVMLSSIVSAVNLDYLSEQINDFETALKMQDSSQLAEHYGIEEAQVESKIEELVKEYKQIGDNYTSAKEFANYIISDNSKEIFEDKTDVNIEEARGAIAYQMVMTEIIDRNTNESFNSLKEALSELNPQLSIKYTEALTKYNKINRAKKEDIKTISKLEKKVTLKQKQLNALNNRLLKINQIKEKQDTKSNERSSNSYNKLVNKITQVESEIANLSSQLEEKNSILFFQKEEMSNLNASTRALANQLDIIDPISNEEMISELTIEETQNRLEDLDKELTKLRKTNPQLVEKVLKLAESYNKGLDLWKRNADTITDLTDPELGLDRIGTLFQKKKKVGTTTLDFLKKLQKTSQEETDFLLKVQSSINEGNIEQEDQSTNEDINEQQKAEQNPGEDILQEISSEANPLEIKLNELNQLLKELVEENNFLLDNFSDDSNILLEDKAPTEEELTEYENLRDKFNSGDINKLIGRPVENISKRIKERSGLTDQEIQRYQNLSQKMRDWRIVTGTNKNGISVQDILNQIEAYTKKAENINEKPSAQQVLEIAEQGQSEFSIDISDPDYVNSMDKVNIKQNKIQTTISHLKMSTILNSGFNTTYLREDNVGTDNNPILVDVYELEKDGKSFEIQYTQDNHRVIISRKNTQNFLSGMGMQTVKYNTKTGWGYVFKDGTPMESDFGINLINNPDINILNPQLIYELKPGDKVSFVVDIQDMFNNDTIIPLLKEGKIDQAKKLMSIYTVNESGEVLGFLKSGAKAKGSNFEKVREEAINKLQQKLENTETTLEDLANDNTSSIIKLPFTTEVVKTFVGTPNIELNSDGTVKTYKISKEQSERIIDFGYAENGILNGKLNREKDNVRMTFIPKTKNTPYVVILHGNTKVAFPVALTSNTNLLKDQVLEILSSQDKEQNKITNIIILLKQNGIEPAQFDLGGLKDNSEELNKVLQFLESKTIPYNKKQIESLSKEEFINATEIVIDLNKPAFTSPKLKINLSKKLVNTKINEETSSKKLTKEQKESLLIQHLTSISKAIKQEEVGNLVMETGDEVFIKEYLENKQFQKDVIKTALHNKVVPVINTKTTLENLLKDVIDLDSVDIPLDVKNNFKEEVQNLKENPTEENIKNLAEKVMKSTEDRYKLINSSVNTDNLYHISSTESEEQMFENGYVRVVGDFYKKVDNRYTSQQLLEGLYNKYKNNTLPPHMTEDYLSLEDFIDQMPNNTLDIYKVYYNTQPRTILSKKATIVGNDQYLKEEFKGDFAEFIQKEKNKGSKLYSEVLQHFQVTDKGIIKEDFLTRDKIDQYQKDMIDENLGNLYASLLNYSLINKHINLEETPQNLIFVEDNETENRLRAVNNPNLLELKKGIKILNTDQIIVNKVKESFIQYKGYVYENVGSNKQGDTIFQRIVKQDTNFIITEVSAPFNTKTLDNEKDLGKTGTTITKTKGTSFDC